ncbi:MAG: hypothetical protein C0458_05590 [Methylobacterium sp.]|nr:hypothetical protein [Methylobacterium sp.]
MCEHSLMSPLHLYRARNELTLQGMAAKIGTSPGYLHDLEKGRRRPSPRLVVEIERTTGISRHDLLPEIFGAKPAPKTEAA